jgi:hypothetical protein
MRSLHVRTSAALADAWSISPPMGRSRARSKNWLSRREALSGLAPAFFYAGARALLVSHWAVGSNAAMRLTISTFDNLNATPRSAAPKRRGAPCSLSTTAPIRRPCRTYSEQCIEPAKAAHSEQERDLLLEMARAWSIRLPFKHLPSPNLGNPKRCALLISKTAQ